MEHAPQEIRDNLKAHASMLNVPGIGVDGNDCYSAVQINIQPAVAHGTGTCLIVLYFTAYVDCL